MTIAAIDPDKRLDITEGKDSLAHKQRSRPSSRLFKKEELLVEALHNASTSEATYSRKKSYV
eukprot:c5047_g1_i1 orf=92-277(-)